MSDSAGYSFLCESCGLIHLSDPEAQFCSTCGERVVKQEEASVAAALGKRVLVVDDSLLARKKIAAILKKLGCEVDEAADGAAGIEKANTGGYDLIVLDV
jgi:PleD family two-component response regulator